MPKIKGSSSSSPPKNIRPAINPEVRESKLISLAMDLVERRLIEGTASSQETTHFLKLATVKASLEKEKLIRENKLLEAKTNAIEHEESKDQLYKDAIEAMKRYSGNRSVGDYVDEDY